MPFVHREVSARQVAANQANARHSTGPKTATGKARVALNALKHGAYAKADNCRRQVMLRRGQDPGEYEQLHQDLIGSWQPDDAMQAMVVKTLADKTWDKLQLRREWLEGQLAGLELGQIQLQRRNLAARRWPQGLRAGLGGLCGAQDSPHRFSQILQLLDRLQQWCKEEDCPDEYPQVTYMLYGESMTAAGQRIGELFVQLFDEDEAVCEKARRELPKWIAQERSDVQQDRALYQSELSLQRKVNANLPEDRVVAREAALERQIVEHTRLLLQLKSKRSLWEAEPEGEEAAATKDSETGKSGNGSGPNIEGATASATGGAESTQEAVANENGAQASEGIGLKEVAKTGKQSHQVT